jgi:hypothetical protein
MILCLSLTRTQVLAAIAAETIDRNGLSHRIDAFHCSSFELTVADEEKLGHCTLPERATVIVSEVSVFVWHSRKRLLGFTGWVAHRMRRYKEIRTFLNT